MQHVKKGFDFQPPHRADSITCVKSAYNVYTHAAEKTGQKNVELGRSTDNGEAAQFLENLTKMTGMMVRVGMVYRKETRCVSPTTCCQKSNSLQAADRPHRPQNMSRVLAEQKLPCCTIFACAEEPKVNTTSCYVNHYED